MDADRVPPVDVILIPIGAPEQLPEIVVFLTVRLKVPVAPTETSIPLLRKLVIEQFSTFTCLPARYLMPFSPLPAPFIDKLRSVTTSFVPALMMTALTVANRIPASVPSPLIVMDLVIVTAPNPPGSSTEISPHAAV